MKKILTLLFCAGALSSFAQPSQQWPSNNRNDNSNGRYENSNDHNRNSSQNDSRVVYDNNNNNRRGYEDRRYDESYSFAVRERDNQIARINREYDSRINAIKGKWLMRPQEKNRQIRELEYQRSEQIRSLYARFDDKRNKYNDKYYDKNYNWRH